MPQTMCAINDSVHPPHRPAGGCAAVTSLTRWVLAHKRLVAAWAVLTVIGMATVSHSSKAMNQKFTVPGKQGFQTNQTIIHRFNLTGGDTGTILPTVTLPKGTTVSSPGIK